MKTIILAAGVGSRLGRPFPKSMSVLPTGESIMGRQIRIFNNHDLKEIFAVVGFKKTIIMEEYPSIFYRYNPYYYITNTSKSLLCAIEDLDDDILWVNGDVVFDEGVVKDILDTPGNVVAVDQKKVGEEEVKYATNNAGNIVEISKTVDKPEGEAVGLNKIRRQDLPAFIQALRDCGDQDYFEKAIELIIERGVTVVPKDISQYRCIEVDFDEDWDAARKMFGRES